MSVKTSLAGAAAAIGLTALAYPAQAATYTLNYTHGSPVGTPITFSAKLTGMAAWNVITVTGFSNAIYNGTPWNPTPPYVNSYSDFFALTALAPLVSLDNSVTDIVFGDTGLNQTVAFGPAQGVPGDIVVFSSFGFTPGAPDTNGAEQPLGTLTITEDTAVAVPEPSAVVAMLGLGLGALASKVRKQG
ncbi:MAG: PEP-CTERM sorting domain-containing protein [Microcystis sp. M015S2]|uniref:PEP-CTERM sorting domain-containing protein n=1 Tax=unclassified Microcystis TaxID=2643300 RepID=UPI002584DFBF|nr:MULTISPECIES: PEP-CTERM sorting domain-containing protein [unclassified Microcystis]MCA2710092.1 PEP-CTERM sorting domain-containing protein [Microcystis sp. M025S2]MCA2741896.1 PEP-CTERM sorting domain-containing protein [Microcystis sp. M015S2]MCA2759338.1 PEP-CTERM sorting domain-containing protein [Microcystis sp. M145S2]